MDFRPSQEHEIFRHAVARFARQELARYVQPMETDDRFPVEVFRSLGEMGFLGTHFPEEYGGAVSPGSAPYTWRGISTGSP